MARHARIRTSLVYLVLLAAAAGSGCRLDPGALTGDPDEPDAMEPPGDAPAPVDAPVAVDAPVPIDAPVAVDAPVPIDAAPLPEPDVLVGRGLITRYFIDEATGGRDPVELEDAAPDPLPLNISYAGQLDFIEQEGHRGLRWTTTGTVGRAAADLAEDGKVWLALDGSTTGTIELVVHVEEVKPEGSRLSQIGEGDDSGVFTLRIDEPGSFAFNWNNNDGGRVSWAADVNNLGRAVVHVVFDSSQADQEDRVKLYVNGEAQERTGGTPPGRDQAIDIVNGSSTAYVLGNTEQADRAVRGTFYYASMYSAALDQGEVAHNTTILLANDDGPVR